jgi:hypothetical protein
MDYLPHFLKYYNIDLQPTNSVCIDLESAKTVLYPGAHIATSNPYEYFHHGIVIDINTPDISIIHLWGAEKDSSRVQITNLPIFLAGGIDSLGKKTRRLYLINYDGDTLAKQQETVKVANELLEKADDIIYDLATLNCESFACFCRTGKWNSEQIERIKNFLVEKAPEIYEQVKDADEKNRKNIFSVLQTIPSDALNPSEKVMYDQLCQQCSYESAE